MRLVLQIGFVIGCAATAYFAFRLISVFGLENGGLAVLALLGPLGSSTLLMAVCGGSLGIMMELDAVRQELALARTDRRQATTPPTPAGRIEPPPPKLTWSD